MVWALLPVIAFFVGSAVVEDNILGALLWTFTYWLPPLLLWAVVAWLSLRNLRRLVSTPDERLVWWELFVSCAVLLAVGVALAVGMVAVLSSGMNSWK